MHAMATAAVKQLQKRLKSLSSTEPSFVKQVSMYGKHLLLDRKDK